jgi:hypothetical protein
MEIINDPNQPDPEKYYKRYRRGKAITGTVIVGIGITLLMAQMGVPIPSWVLSWKMLLIVIGLAVGLKHNFVRPGWIIPVLIGFAFIIADLYPEFSIKQYVLPVIFIMIGLVMIFKPRGRWRGPNGGWDRHRYRGDCGPSGSPASPTSEDTIEITSVFGGIKKNIISNDFKGGEITCVFGGAEINLMQCDIHGKVTLEANQVLGGTKLIIPSNWQIQSQEVVAVLGGIEDKRPLNMPTDPDKILVLKGASVLGGLEILSY